MANVATRMEDLRDALRELVQQAGATAITASRDSIGAAEDALDGELALKMKGVREAADALLDAVREADERREARTQGLS